MVHSYVATGGDPAVAAPPDLLSVEAVARLFSCSPRHVHRLARAGRMPPSVRVGRLRRWSRRAIELWIASGGSAGVKGGAAQ